MNISMLRHASAGTKRQNPLLDLKRPLDKEGKQHCLQLAQVLNALKITYDLIVSSPLKRALQTAQFLATETGYEAQILHSNALAPEAALADFQALLRECKNRENLLLVGHNPNLQAFLGSLVVPHDCPTAPQLRLRKGAIARLTLSSTGSRQPAVLQSLLDPRTVRSLYATSTRSSRRNTSRK